MLAIIIPYYKIHFFRETLKSLNNQTNKNFKVYIGNDASPDNPEHIIESTLKNIEYKYFYFETNEGAKNLVQQWERCMNLVDDKYKWFSIIGDDDYVDENYVESFYKNLEDINKNQSNVIRYAVQKVVETKLDSKIYFNPMLQTPNDFLFTRERSSLSEFIFSYASYQKYKFKPIPLAWGADFLAVFEFADNTPIYAINNSKVYVRVSNISISGNTNDKQMNIKKTNALAQVYFYILKNYNSTFNTNQKLYLYNKIKKIYFNNRSSIFKLNMLFKACFYK